MMIVLSLLALTLLGASLGGALGWASKTLKVEGDPRVDEIEAMLPGGQCGQCGEPGCRQAAEKMVSGSLSPNCCPPGGKGLAASVAELLGISLNDDGEQVTMIAVIDESNCSGCTRCFKACPFDAIVGASKQMHSVISQVCTGCNLCAKACPQGCLTMQPQAIQPHTWNWPKPQVA